jgi:hypothetical protein
MVRLLDGYELVNGKKTERPKVTYHSLVSVVCVGRKGRVQPLFKESYGVVSEALDEDPRQTSCFLPSVFFLHNHR